jgi:hypothetical protein
MLKKILLENKENFYSQKLADNKLLIKIAFQTIKSEIFPSHFPIESLTWYDWYS